MRRVRCYLYISIHKHPAITFKQRVLKPRISILHIALHFIVPAVVATVFFRKKWLVAYLTMIAALLIDLDHLLADPIYDPQRCSVGFHPLHGLLPILLYLALCIHRKTRLIGLGLVIHMALDVIDCQVTNGIWFT